MYVYERGYGHNNAMVGIRGQLLGITTLLPSLVPGIDLRSFHVWAKYFNSLTICHPQGTIKVLQHSNHFCGYDLDTYSSLLGELFFSVALVKLT